MFTTSMISTRYQLHRAKYNELYQQTSSNYELVIIFFVFVQSKNLLKKLCSDFQNFKIFNYQFIFIFYLIDNSNTYNSIYVYIVTYYINFISIMFKYYKYSLISIITKIKSSVFTALHLQRTLVLTDYDEQSVATKKTH